MKKISTGLVLLVLSVALLAIVSCADSSPVYYADYTPLSDIIPKMANEPDTFAVKAIQS